MTHLLALLSDLARAAEDAAALMRACGTWDCVERAHAAGIRVLVWDANDRRFEPYRP